MTFLIKDAKEHVGICAKLRVLLSNIVSHIGRKDGWLDSEIKALESPQLSAAKVVIPDYMHEPECFMIVEYSSPPPGSANNGQKEEGSGNLSRHPEPKLCDLVVRGLADSIS